MEFYTLKSISNADEYIVLAGDFLKIKRPCMRSEYQFLDKKTIRLEISEDGGLEIPDVIFQDGIWFISDKIKDAFDNYGIDYVFYKKAEIVSNKFGIFENFWIMVPPRIDCLDIDESDLDNDWDFNDGLIPNMEFTKISISPKLTGRFEIFKIIGINDYNIYISSGVNDLISSISASGVTTIKLS